LLCAYGNYDYDDGNDDADSAAVILFLGGLRQGRGQVGRGVA
jgi:hypothetical protein